jgi:hypothetical protein
MPQLSTRDTEGTTATRPPVPHARATRDIAIIRLRLSCATCGYHTEWHNNEPDADTEFLTHTRATCATTKETDRA